MTKRHLIYLQTPLTQTADLPRPLSRAQVQIALDIERRRIRVRVGAEEIAASTTVIGNVGGKTPRQEIDEMRKYRAVGTVVETEIFPGIVVGIGVGALRVIVVCRQRATQSVLRLPIGVAIFPIFLRRNMLNSSQSYKRLKRTFTESSINALAHPHRQRARFAWPVSTRSPRMTN
jgi:hypothetical protein